MFDDGVFELSDDTGVVGHLSTVIERAWSPFRRHHQVWLLVTWADGRRERIFEDYQPWTAVRELQSGTLCWGDAIWPRVGFKVMSTPTHGPPSA